jgi:predicted Zn-dependent peptidase
MTTAPLLSKEMIEKEKPIVLEELNRALDNPKRILWYKYNELAYKVSNYKHPVIGYRETIQNFNEKLVKEYFYSHYVPSNTYIVVDGNINKDEVLAFVKETFGKVRGKFYKPPPVPLEPEQKEIRSAVIKKPQVTRAYVAIGWQAPPVSSEETFPANVLEEIFFGGRTSIMYQELREKGLVQAIYGGYSGYKGTSQFIIYYITDVDKKDKVKNRIFEILKRYLKEGIPEDLVENAKRRLINGEVFSREEVTHDAESIGYAASVVGNLDYDLKYIQKISAVKKEDVDRFLRKYIKFDAYTEVQLLPEEKQ